MSSDNGTYILETYGPEYRIAYAQAIDNIYNEYDEESSRWKPDPISILEIFGASDIFTNLSDAWDQATFIESQNDFSSEYGTCLITDFADYKFPDKEEYYEAFRNR